MVFTLGSWKESVTNSSICVLEIVDSDQVDVLVFVSVL